MTSENRFNLVDEPWIPVVDEGLVSMRQLFSNPEYRALGGNAVQKIALTKLLLAIAQSACTPKDDEAWAGLGAEGLARSCLEYLDKWHDRFWLYGNKPFLQMPAIKAAEIKPYGAVLPDVSTGNTTVLFESHIERPLYDADKALLLVVLLGFSLGGKKTDNSIVLTPGYKGKENEKGRPSTSKPGPSVGFMGFMHSFMLGNSIHQTLWMNLFTNEYLGEHKIYSGGLGSALWENMPQGEDCEVARQLRTSLLGRLLPLSRFCLLANDGLHYSEGIAHQGYKDGMVDPSVAVNYSVKEAKVIWIDPERRPWRQLTALLSFLKQGSNDDFVCDQIKYALSRARQAGIPAIGVWSGGLRVSSNAGEQYVSGTDDFVESSVFMHSDSLGDSWYTILVAEMNALDNIARSVYAAATAYYKEMQAENDLPGQASNLFWQLCERKFQALVDACANGEGNEQARLALRKTFAGYARKAYEMYCPGQTARQLDAWAKCQPNLSKYLTL